MRETGLPFDDIKNLVANLPEFDADAFAHTQNQLVEAGFKDGDTMRDSCEWYSAWSGRSPAVHRGVVTLFAGTHTLDNAITNNSASEDTLQEVTDISSGSSVLNRLCHQHDLGLKLFDLALQLPVADISEEPALDEKSCAGTIAFGMEAIAGGADLLCIAALEPHVSASNVAILTFLHSLDVSKVAKTFGFPEDNLIAAINLVKGNEKNPLEVLRRLGGRETAALCGAILAARSQHIPVVLDSVAALASASVLYHLNENSISHCKFAQDFEQFDKDIVASLNAETVVKGQLASNSSYSVAIAGGLIKSSCLALQGRA